MERDSSSILRDIGHRVPNLEQFRIGIRCNHRADDIPTMNANMAHIGGIRKLKTLYIGATPKFTENFLIDSMIENNIPIEELRLYRPPLSHVMAMQSIRKLLINNVSNEEMIETIQKMKQLKEFLVSLCKNLNLSSIKEVLRHGENLTFFAVAAHLHTPLDIDSEYYNSLLVLVRGRVKVEIHCFELTLTVPRNVLDANRAWIDVLHLHAHSILNRRISSTFDFYYIQNTTKDID